MKLILHSKAFKSLEVSLVAPPAAITSEYKLLYLTFDSNIRGYGLEQTTAKGLQYCIGDYTLLYEALFKAVSCLNPNTV